MRLTEEQKKANEKQFESALRDYMLDSYGKKYRFGGIINVMSSVRSLLEDFAENAEELGLDEEALLFAAIRLNHLEADCNLAYAKEL